MSSSARCKGDEELELHVLVLLPPPKTGAAAEKDDASRQVEEAIWAAEKCNQWEQVVLALEEEPAGRPGMNGKA